MALKMCPFLTNLSYIIRFLKGIFMTTDSEYLFKNDTDKNEIIKNYLK